MKIISHLHAIYAIVCLKTGKMYVGSSQDVNKRLRTHRTHLRRGIHHNSHLQRAWDLYGEDEFLYLLLEKVTSDLLTREQWWIDYLKSTNDAYGYNIAITAGAPMKGRKHSSKTKRIFSETRSGEQNPNFRDVVKTCVGCGKSFKKAGKRTKYCSHECYTGDSKRFTPELIEKFSRTSKGRTRSVESLTKSFEKRAQLFLITDPYGQQFVIKGLAKFCRENNLDQGSMSHVVRGRQKSHKGWLCIKFV